MILLVYTHVSSSLGLLCVEPLSFFMGVAILSAKVIDIYHSTTLRRLEVINVKNTFVIVASGSYWVLVSSRDGNVRCCRIGTIASGAAGCVFIAIVPCKYQSQ